MHFECVTFEVSILDRVHVCVRVCFHDVGNLANIIGVLKAICVVMCLEIFKSLDF